MTLTISGNAALGGNKGFFVLFGAPGTWKSTEALATFPDALYIASSVGLDQFYTHVLMGSAAGQAAGLRPPKKIVVLDQYAINGGPLKFDTKGDMIRVPQRETFEQLVMKVTKQLDEDKQAGRGPTFRNIIIDEASVFWDRFFLEAAAECSKAGNNDGRAHHQAIQVWTRQVIDRFRTVLSMGANLVAVAHDVEPDGKKKGGPQMPNNRTSRIFGADSHMALLSDFEDGGLLSSGPSQHVWRAFASKSMTSKVRGISADRFDEIKSWPLAKIVQEAGFQP